MHITYYEKGVWEEWFAICIYQLLFGVIGNRVDYDSSQSISWYLSVNLYIINEGKLAH